MAERLEISRDMQEKYQRCASELLDISKAMATFCPKGSSLRHCFYTIIQKEEATDTDWTVVISDNQRQPSTRKFQIERGEYDICPNRRKSQEEWEEWEIFPNRLYCSHYLGTGDKSVLKDFRTLARKGQSMLADYLSLASSKSLELPDIIKWQLPPMLRSKLDDLPGYYYFIYLITKSGPLSCRAFEHTLPEIESESNITIDTLRFRYKSHHEFDQHAAEVIGYWLRPAKYLELVTTQADQSRHAITPQWDANRRELWVGNTLIKRYRLKAPNQERILETFEEEHWPPVINAPLAGVAVTCYNDDDDDIPPPGLDEIDSGKRLRDAVRMLNSHHQNCNIIKFACNGTGEGVLWNFCESPR